MTYDLQGNKHINVAGLTLLKEFEICKLKAYLDEAGVWTIGWGHTHDVHEDDVITNSQADDLLKEDLQVIETTINRLVDVYLTNNQFSALCCLVYNIGEYNFSKSVLLQKLNLRDYIGAGEQILVWNKEEEDGKMAISDRLYRRRKAEHDLYKN